MAYDGTVAPPFFVAHGDQDTYVRVAHGDQDTCVPVAHGDQDTYVPVAAARRFVDGPRAT